MRLIIDKESFKVFSKIIQTCTKLGEDVFFECRTNGLTIKSVNDTRSLFFFSNFDPRFFEEFQVPKLIDCKFKAKSCLIPFKSSLILEKSLNSLEFYVDEAKDAATFQMNFENEDISMHEVNYVGTNLQIELDDESEFENYLMAKIKMFVNLFNHFPNQNDYCVMTVNEDKISFETYNFKVNEVRTAFSIKSEAFLEYNVKTKIRSTFILKSMKTFLASLDRNSNCYFYFEEDNCPIHLLIKNSFVEHKFVIASIDVDVDSMSEVTTSVQLNTEDLDLTNLRDAIKSNGKDKSSSQTKTTNDDEASDASSFDSDDNFSFKPSNKNRSTKVKNERYKSIYTSDSASNSCFSNENSKGTQPTNQTNSNQPDNKQKENASNKASQKQINDSQLMFDNDDNEFSMDIENEIDFDVFDKDDNLNDKQSQRSQNQHSQKQKSLSQNANSSKTLSESFSEGSSQNRKSSSQNAATSAIRSPTIHPTNQEPANSSAIHTKLSNLNSQTADFTETGIRDFNNINSEINTNPSAIQTNQTVQPTLNPTVVDPITASQSHQQSEQISLKFDQTATTINQRKATLNSHSTQAKEEENVKIDSFSISAIEPNNSTHNKTVSMPDLSTHSKIVSMPDFSNDESLDFGDDLEDDYNNQSLENRIEQQKGGYESFLMKMPTICVGEQQKKQETEEKEDNQLFFDFMNKHRSLLP